MSSTMTDDHGSTNGAHGGVGHLLRMAKTQCGVSLAFAALRKADGGFAIATFPTLTADPTWSIEAIDELVRQTWEDPHLGGGTVLVRSGRVLKGMWTGQGHHIKLAAAALSDPEAPDHPWGLLCVAEPLAGHFEQDQLNLLGHLAVRLTSYLRARQQVLEGSFATEQTSAPQTVAPQAAPASVESGYEPMVETPFVAAEPAPVSSETSDSGLQVQSEPTEFDHVFEEVEDEHPLDRAAETYEPMNLGWGSATQTPEPRADDWEFLGLDEIDWVEAAVPAPAPVESAPRVEAPAPADEPMTGPAGFEEVVLPEPNLSFATRDESVVEGPAPRGVGDLDALLGPDPVTGLATLTTLVGRLSATLTRVANNEGSVGLILVEVSPADGSGELGPTALMTVAGRLTNHFRDRDLVARIGPSLFAILVDLRPGSVELEAIEERTVFTLTQGIASNAGGLRARSALASADAGSTVSAEELLRQAVDRLQGR